MIDSKVFAFDEADHLTRIHLKLALEDVGFVVAEEAATIAIHADEATPAMPVPVAPIPGA